MLRTVEGSMRTAMSLFSASLLAACAASPQTTTDEQDVVARNMLASNMLASNMLASNMLASNMLASNMLASNQLQLNPDGASMLLSTADGRFLLSYIVSCAVPAGTEMIADIPGAPDTAPPANPYTCTAGSCSFPGLLGLAPKWIDHKLKQDDSGWVSACLLARVNALNVSEEISMRGPDAPLAVGAAEEALYTVQEGAFYGDVFTYPKPIVWIACEGSGQVNGTFGGLVDRKCARPDPGNPGKTYCGFTYAGYCGDFTPDVATSAHACSFDSGDGGFYGDCRASSAHPMYLRDFSPLGGEIHQAFREVVTTYVTP
jgi:hypothetical protein